MNTSHAEQAKSPTMILTPKGKRFADVIRKELSDPDSIISGAVRNLKGWDHQIKQHPKEFRFALEGMVNKSVVVKCGACNKHSDTLPICYITDVSLWYHHDDLDNHV